MILPRLLATAGLLTSLAFIMASCAGQTSRPQVAPNVVLSSAPTTRVVTDDLGRRIEIKGTPERVVALSPTMVEILFAVGVTPVGRPTGANYPEAARQLADVGTAHKPNGERIADLKPDLIIVSSTSRQNQLSQLDAYGIPTVQFGIGGYGDVLKTIRKTGQIVNQEADAEKAAKEIEASVAKTKAKIPAKRPTVFVLIGNKQVFYGALPTSYVGSLVKELGATNIASGTEDKRYHGFAEYSLDRLVGQNPDVIIAIRPMASRERAPSALPEFQKDGRWQELKAVKTQRVHEVSPLLFFQNPGLRVVDALNELAPILYSETFGGKP